MTDLDKVLLELKKHGETLRKIEKRLSSVETTADLTRQSYVQVSQRITAIEAQLERGYGPAQAGCKRGEGLELTRYLSTRRRRRRMPPFQSAQLEKGDAESGATAWKKSIHGVEQRHASGDVT